MKILFVEDEPELSALAVDTMESMGHTVVAVANVHSALEILEKDSNSYNLLIADHRLPDGWGIALCLQCRVKYPNVRLGVVSGCLTPRDINTLDEYQIPWFSKPVLYSTVIKRITRTPPASKKVAKLPPPEEPQG